MMIRVLCFVILAVISISISPAISEKESIYDILQANGLPVGIFPKGVKEFSFDDKTGKFSVSLNQSCNAKYETELRYSTNITGVINDSEIQDLSGIEAQELFLWFPVKGIKVDKPSSGIIYFDVGVVRKQYSLSLFETSRDCVAVRGVIKVESTMFPLYQVDETLGRDII